MSEAGGDAPLRGRRIALPEAREAARLAAMLRAQGAEIVGCPLVAIVDAPDPAPVAAWLARFVAAPCDDLVLLTGEGVRRLYDFARRSGTEAGFRAALGRTRKITRGPKPAQALREIGLQPDLRAAEPTTTGIIAALAEEDLRGRRIGVQLYPRPHRQSACRISRRGRGDPRPGPALQLRLRGGRRQGRGADRRDGRGPDRRDRLYRRAAGRAALRRGAGDGARRG
jgi:hypothetical protein